MDGNPSSGFLSDADLSRCILEKTLVGFGLLDVLRERLGFSLFLRSPLLFGVLDSEYCDVSWIFEFLPEHLSKLIRASVFLVALSYCELFQLLLALTDDNAYHSIPEGLRRTRAYLDLLRFALSLFLLCFARWTWVGEIELRWSTHGKYFKKRSCVRVPRMAPTC
uniref:Uncharacterized protein n=1 Tax=Tanacetum cinerariifolium TaxID=118510 RepID=A0A699IY83_TANCI|nr:hypothetical protein [Tanacetum cinerariifolium]